MNIQPPPNRENPLNESLVSWLDSDLGRLLLQEERVLQGELAGKLFGYQLLEISHFPGDLSYLEDCPVQHKVRIGPAVSRQSEGMIGLPEQLPIATDSIDVVILPHALDFATDPKQVLREVERVLIPEGRLIVCGFNPYSFWGLKRLVRGRKKAPWSGHFLSYPRLLDWLSLLGFDIEQIHCRMFRPPLQQSTLMSKLSLLEAHGPRLLPWLCGVYVVQAVKRVSTVTPIRPKWHIEKKLANSVVEPTSSSTREING